MEKLIDMEEMRKVIKSQKNKTSSLDEFRAELWKAIVSDESTLQHFVDFCNLYWIRGTISNAWHNANIVIIFKKGNAELLKNYRPTFTIANEL